MHRIDQDGHDNNRFQEGDPALGRPATRVGADWLNAVQEELCNAIEETGATLDKNDNGQLAAFLVAQKVGLEAATSGVADLASRVSAQGEWIYPTPKTRVVLVPGNSWQARAIGEWERQLDFTWRSTAEGARLVLHLAELLPNGVEVTSIQLIVRPGAARTGTDRLRALVYALEPNFLAPAVPSPTTPAGLAAAATVYSNDTTGIQVIELAAGASGWNTGQSILINREVQDVMVVVESGLDPSTHAPDTLIAARIFAREPGPRGI